MWVLAMLGVGCVLLPGENVEVHVLAVQVAFFALGASGVGLQKGARCARLPSAMLALHACLHTLWLKKFMFP